MFKNHYYCLIAGLPDLIFEENWKGLTNLRFRNELEGLLSRSDYHLLELIYLQKDNKNLFNLLLKNDFQFDELGNYTEEYLINQIESPSGIVEYMKVLITDFESESFDKSPLYCENKLLELFYNYVLNTKNNFIKQWFTFDRNLKNIITAVNCNKYGYPLEKNLIPNQNNNSLNEILLRKNFIPEQFVDENIPLLEQLLQITESSLDLTEKEKAIDYIRWSFLDELSIYNYFTIEKILSFVLKLDIINRWRDLDDEAGKAYLKRLITEMELSYSFSEDFFLKQKK